MPVTRRYQCPDCERDFSFLHMTLSEPPPSYCPMCGSYVGDDPQSLPSSPHIAGIAGKSGDQVYRAMENASIGRAEQAAELTGENMSHMKITNAQDNQRAGDSGTGRSTTPVNPVTQVMAAAPGMTGMQGRDAVAGYIDGAAAGYGAHSGSSAREQVIDIHRQIGGRLIAQGNMGNHAKGAA